MSACKFLQETPWLAQRLRGTDANASIVASTKQSAAIVALGSKLPASGSNVACKAAGFVLAATATPWLTAERANGGTGSTPVDRLVSLPHDGVLIGDDKPESAPIMVAALAAAAAAAVLKPVPSLLQLAQNAVTVAAASTYVKVVAATCSMKEEPVQAMHTTAASVTCAAPRANNYTEEQMVALNALQQIMPCHAEPEPAFTSAAPAAGVEPSTPVQLSSVVSEDAPIDTTANAASPAAAGVPAISNPELPQLQVCCVALAEHQKGREQLMLVMQGTSFMPPGPGQPAGQLLPKHSTDGMQEAEAKLSPNTQLLQSQVQRLYRTSSSISNDEESDDLDAFSADSTTNPSSNNSVAASPPVPCFSRNCPITRGAAASWWRQTH